MRNVSRRAVIRGIRAGLAMCLSEGPFGTPSLRPPYMLPFIGGLAAERGSPFQAGLSFEFQTT
jgi:hypothetical protein